MLENQTYKELPKIKVTQLFIYFFSIYSSAASEAIKSLATNSASRSRMALLKTFLINFLRDGPRFFENLRILSLFLTRFSFFAFTRHAARAVSVRVKDAAGANACNGNYKIRKPETQTHPFLKIHPLLNTIIPASTLPPRWQQE